MSRPPYPIPRKKITVRVMPHTEAEIQARAVDKTTLGEVVDKAVALLPKREEKPK